MIGLLQRVTEAEVTVADDCVGRIAHGLLVLVGVERGDDDAAAERLAERLVGYRVFGDEHGRMNRCLADVDGGLLLVPQFTLAADTRKGTRPGFSTAASPDEGERLFTVLVDAARARHHRVATGRFGAHMRVALVNDGPVTFRLQVPAAAG